MEDLASLDPSILEIAYDTDSAVEGTDEDSDLPLEVELHPSSDSNKKYARPTLVEDVVRIILTEAVKDARDPVTKELKGITSYLLLSRKFLKSLIKAAYRAIYIRDRTTLELFYTSIVSNPRLARFVRAFNIAPPCVPFVHGTPSYVEPQYSNVPAHTAGVLTTLSPYLRGLFLLIPVHPTILYAFRSSPFPKLRVLDAFHPFLLDALSIREYNKLLSPNYEDLTPVEIGVSSDQSSNQEDPVVWPKLERLSIRFDGYAPRSPTLDLRYITSPRHFIVRPWPYEKWEYSLVNFLVYIFPPPAVDAIALMWTPVESPVHRGFEFLFHPKTVIPVVGDTRAHTFSDEPGMEFFHRLSFVTADSVSLPAFWISAKAFVAQREVDDSIFLPEQFEHLVGYIEPA
ncbi:hypothetical protein VNI00_013384 [Paramarasmius palmivorus]|uniref:Uncharacterized protein n=1 Tax=Paramarasmius palmivorus TaxID=297713 RepID=A0AAW0BYZ7_9AGAR